MLDGVDWARTPLGGEETWSAALRGAVDLITQTRFPATLFWGPERVLIYNQAYAYILADKHPAALGARTEDVFPEAWDYIGGLLDGVMAGGGATWTEDALVPLTRNGGLSEAYFTFSYSAIHGADGTIEGAIDIVAETTAAVVELRRQGLLTRLRGELADLELTDDVLARATAVLLTDPEDIEAIDPAGVPVPLGSARPALAVRPAELTVVDDGYHAFVRAMGLALAQAFDRIAAREAERRIAQLEHRMSETLQRSLLPQPAEPDHLEVAVRYLPAAEAAQVGGDWYDSFVGPDGALTLVVGDVTGHDRNAAAAMAQVRNLLRGVSWTREEPPSAVLAGVDRAMVGLEVDVLASAVLARVEQTETLRRQGLRQLTWSNAGHPPPILIAPDGTARLLEATPDTLLGLGLGTRAHHTVVLEPEAAVVLYTDGLIERPGVPLDDGFAWLLDAVSGRPERTAEATCDHILAQLDADVADDVALLVLKAHPED